MKKLVLLLALVSVSVTYAKSSTLNNLLFSGGFGGGAYTVSNSVYTIPAGSPPDVEVWAGFANEDTSFYPLVLQSGATITFDAELLSSTPVNARVVFEYQPYPNTTPSFNTDSVTISGTGTNTYTINVPSQGANTFSSFLFYLNDVEAAGSVENSIMMENFTITGLDDGDTTAPTPAQSSFSSAPAAISDSAISMTATTATDTESDVLYYFTCTTDSAFDSGWISESTYTASGLTSATTYEFTVQARDDSYAENTTTVSAAASATTTGSDTAAPSPNPSTGSIDASSVTVEVTATVASDASPVEYQFVNTSGNGPSSGWQTSNVYVASGLSSGTEYSYTIQARDLSSATNTTTVSEAYTVTTGSAPSETDETSSLTTSLHDVAKEGLTVVSTDAGRAISFDSNGADFGSTTSGDGGRNYLASIANNFDEVDFTAEVTVVISSGDQQAYLGIGKGELGTWQLPDYENAAGCYYLQVQENENATFASDQFGNVVSGAPGTSLWNPEDDAVNPGVGQGTHRLRLVNDTTAGTLTFTTDTNYDGTFVADQNEGSLNLTEVWNPSLNPTQDPNYDVDEAVYVAFGQSPTALTWEENSGGGGGSVNTFPTSGGSGDDGAYFQMDSTAGSWSVGVVSTDNSDPANAEFAIADFGFAPEQLITFQMDMKEFSNPSGTATGGIKIEFYDALGSPVGDMDMGGWRNWPERKVDITSEWATYRWQIGVPQDTDFMKIVPVQHDEVSIGYDNLAFIPNPSYTADTTARIVFGGDDGVVFKDYSIVVDGGSVVVDPFSISSISSITGGSVITWTAQSGVTYEVQYKTSLVGGSWQTTGSSVTGDGAVSATSDVDAASAFFRVIGQ